VVLQVFDDDVHCLQNITWLLPEEQGKVMKKSKKKKKKFSLRPAVLLLLVLSAVIAGLLFYIRGSDWREKLVRSQIDSLLRKGDFQAAEHILQRKVEQNSSDTELMYLLSITRGELGEKNEASSIMWSLIEDEAPEAEKAARWLLEKSKQVPLAEMNQKEFAEFGRLVEILRSIAPRDLEVANHYADFLIFSNRLVEVLHLLEELAASDPMKGLHASKIARQLDMDLKAKKLAEQAAKFLTEKIIDSPGDNKLAISLAQARTFIGDYPGAIVAIENCLRVRSRQMVMGEVEDESSVISSLLIAKGDVYFTWMNEIRGGRDATFNEKLLLLQVLQDAYENAPQHPGIIAILIKQMLVIHQSEDTEIQAVGNVLLEMIPTNISDLIEGMTALMDGNIEKAIPQLSIAATRTPNSVAILNNLAYYLCKDGERLNEALKLIELAFESSKMLNLQLHETRGQILLKLGRYKDAISDLEMALKLPELMEDAHRGLAECYYAIGENEIAEHHLSRLNKQ
jgi:tetratricopeptide (TPR) repeat protein